MFQNALLVAALFGLAVPAAAQLRVEGSIGRNLNIVASIGSPGPYCPPPVRRVRHDSHLHHGNGNGNGHHGDGNGHHGHGHGHGHGHHGHHHGQVYVPGYWTEQHIPARYGWVVDHCGHRRWVMLEAARCERIWVPGRYEPRRC